MTMPNLPVRSRAFRWLLGVLLLAFAAPTFAVEADKQAASFARQAAQADDAGDPARAADLYLQAFHTDPTQPNYLYAAARSELSAGKKTEAEEHFEQFLGLADGGTDRADKARTYLADLRGTRAQDKESAAESAAATGQWGDASTLYEALWNQMPTRWSALYKAGQTARQAGDRARATELLRQYLRDAPKTAADRPDAESLLRSLGAAPADANADAGITRAGVDGTSNTGRIVGWTLLGTGIALVAGGAGLLFYGISEEHALNQDFRLVDGFVTGDISHAQAQTRADAIAVHQSLGLGLAAAGVVAAGIGTWFVLSDGDKPRARRVSVAPGPALAGLSLGWRF